MSLLRPRPIAHQIRSMDPDLVLEENSIDTFMWDDIFNALWRYLRTKLECARIFKAYNV